MKVFDYPSSVKLPDGIDDWRGAISVHNLEGKCWKDVVGIIRYGITETYQFHDMGLSALEELLTAGFIFDSL